MSAVKSMIAAGCVVFASYGFHAYRRSREQQLMETFEELQDRDSFFLSRHEMIAGSYDQWVEGSEWSKRITKYRSVLLSYAEGNVLEVGIGTGRNWEFYPKGCKVVGVDWSKKMLESCAVKEAQVRHALLVKMDARKLLYEDNMFDTVVATFLLSSTPEPEKALSEMVRVCKPTGRILLLDRGIGKSLLTNTLLEMYRYEYIMEYGYDQCMNIEEIVQNANVNVEIEEHKQGGHMHFYLLHPRKT